MLPCAHTLRLSLHLGGESRFPFAAPACIPHTPCMHPSYPLQQLGAGLERIETRGHVFHPSGQSRAVHGAVVSAVHGAAAARARAGATEAFTSEVRSSALRARAPVNELAGCCCCGGGGGGGLGAALGVDSMVTSASPAISDSSTASAVSNARVEPCWAGAAAGGEGGEGR